MSLFSQSGLLELGCANHVNALITLCFQYLPGFCNLMIILGFLFVAPFDRYVIIGRERNSFLLKERVRFPPSFLALSSFYGPNRNHCKIRIQCSLENDRFWIEPAMRYFFDEREVIVLRYQLLLFLLF